jgi:hypothetical protein
LRRSAPRELAEIGLRPASASGIAKSAGKPPLEGRRSKNRLFLDEPAETKLLFYRIYEAYIALLRSAIYGLGGPATGKRPLRNEKGS